jgi:hypothetical protein
LVGASVNIRLRHDVDLIEIISLSFFMKPLPNGLLRETVERAQYRRIRREPTHYEGL